MFYSRLGSESGYREKPNQIEIDRFTSLFNESGTYKAPLEPIGGKYFPEKAERDALRPTFMEMMALSNYNVTMKSTAEHEQNP